MAEHEVTEAMVDAACRAFIGLRGGMKLDCEVPRNGIRRAIEAALAARTTPQPTDASAASGAVAYRKLSDATGNEMCDGEPSPYWRYVDAFMFNECHYGKGWEPLFTYPTVASAGSGKPIAYIRTRNGVIDWAEDCLYSKRRNADFSGFDNPDEYGLLPVYTHPTGAGADADWVLVPREPTAKMIAGAAIAIWPAASDADFQMAREAAMIVLMEGTYQLAPGTSLDTIAAGIATMAAAYRAMLAASSPQQRAGDGG